MPLEIQPTDNENIFIVKTIDPYDIAEITRELHTMLKDKLESIDGRLHCINDMREASISFSDLVGGLGAAFTEDLSIFSHPRVQMIVISENSLVRMGSKAVSQQSQYGKVPVRVFATVEDALAYARGNP